MLFAYVGWVDKGVPQIYFTFDEIETETGLIAEEMDVSPEIYDVSPEYREMVETALSQRILKKWESFAHLYPFDQEVRNAAVA